MADKPNPKHMDAIIDRWLWWRAQQGMDNSRFYEPATPEEPTQAPAEPKKTRRVVAVAPSVVQEISS